MERSEELADLLDRSEVASLDRAKLDAEVIERDLERTFADHATQELERLADAHGVPSRPMDLDLLQIDLKHGTFQQAAGGLLEVDPEAHGGCAGRLPRDRYPVRRRVGEPPHSRRHEEGQREVPGAGS